jgi:uncharacterized protein YcnI
VFHDPTVPGNLRSGTNDNPHMRSIRSVLLSLSAAVLAVVSLLAAPAGAHVELEPAEATAGSTTVLALSFHHGKAGTATTALSVRLPEGASVVSVPDKEGWQVERTTDNGLEVVTWSGGRVPDGEHATFELEVRLPDTPGEVLFPTIQTTEAGELAWIEESEGHGEDSSPAPRLTLIADPNATTTTAAPTTTTTAAETTTTTRSLPLTVNQAELRDDGDESPAPWFIGGGIAALAVIVVGGLWLKRRA